MEKRKKEREKWRRRKLGEKGEEDREKWMKWERMRTLEKKICFQRGNDLPFFKRKKVLRWERMRKLKRKKCGERIEILTSRSVKKKPVTQPTRSTQPKP